MRSQLASTTLAATAFNPLLQPEVCEQYTTLNKITERTLRRNEREGGCTTRRLFMCARFETGWQGWARTSGATVNSRLLYQLSYMPISWREPVDPVPAALACKPDYKSGSNRMSITTPTSKGPSL